MGPTGRALLAAAIAASLSSCAPQPRPPAADGVRPAQQEVPAEFPQAFYDQARAEGKPVYRVDPGRSLVIVEVRRGGTLAHLGHDHVVAARNVTGYVAPETGRADLQVAPDGLVVDEPGLRAAAGMDTQPTESDIAGTRANMLDKVLETGKYPRVRIRIDRKGTGDELAATLTVHGVTRTLDAPADLRIDGGQMEVNGRLEFNQTDFGITPFSILGGAIAVQDRVVLRYEIRAERAR